MSDKELRRDEAALTAVLAEIKAGKIRLYRNLIRQPYVVCDHPEFPALHLQLADKDFRRWLAHFIWGTRSCLLGEREIDRILEELGGRSLSGPLDKVRDPALLQFIESEPVVAVILEFMQTRKRHEATMENLWKELKKFGRDRHLLVRGKNRFPGGPNVLSRKLAPLLAVFEQLGITVEMKRSNGCQVTLTKRLDGSLDESSGESSAPNSSNGQALSAKDDKAERISRLQRRKERAENGQHEP